MKIKTIQVPSRLIFKDSIEFVKKISSIDDGYNKIEFDFSKLERIDPFSLLYVSSELKRISSENSDKAFSVTNFQHCTYESHMGFFKAFGVDYGNNPGEADGSATYIPIKIFNSEDLLNEAKERMVNPAQLLELEAEKIANILTRESSKNLADVLAYCIREILRNVIEHSQAVQFCFCAQYRYSESIVSFAIIDRGIGLKESLKLNPNLNLQNDKDAIIAALQPAVSSKVYKGQKRKPKGEWANSGYGLYMTSNICKRGGSFFIASGNSGFYVSNNNKIYIDIPFNGTVLNLAIDTNRIQDLDKTLRELRDTDNYNILSKNRPSKSSMGLINKK